MMRTFVDEETGMKLTIESQPGLEDTVTVYPPENAQDFPYEQLNQAVYRLLDLAKAQVRVIPQFLPQSFHEEKQA